MEPGDTLQHLPEYLPGHCHLSKLKHQPPGMPHHPQTQSYMRRRAMEGMSKAEVIRCLKRYVAREVFSALRTSAQTVQATT